MGRRHAPLVRTALHLLLAGVFFLYLFPGYWTLASSLKSLTDLMGPPTAFPLQPVLENYEDVLGATPSWRSCATVSSWRAAYRC